jgi:hypothetical protein
VAKKKKVLPVPTKAQLHEIADKLLKQRWANVYSVSRQIVGHEVDPDKIWELLRSECGIFKCEGRCNEWCEVAEEDKQFPDHCANCVAEMDAEEAEDREPEWD